MATTTETALQVKTIMPSLTVDDLQKSLAFFEGLGFTSTSTGKTAACCAGRRCVPAILNSG